MNTFLLVMTGMLVVSMSIIFIWRIGWGLAVLFVLLPFERIGTITIAAHTIRLNQLAALALIVAFFYQVLTRQEKLRLMWFFAPLGAFIVTTFITSYLAHSSRFWQNYISMLFLSVVVFVIAQLIRKRQNLRYSRIGIFGGALLASLFGLWQFAGDYFGINPLFTGLRSQYSHEVLGFARIHSVSNEPLYFACYLFIPLLLGFILIIHKKTQLHKWELISLSLSAVAFLLTLSRGAFLVAFIVGGAIIGILLLAKQLKIKTTLIMIATMIVTIVFAFVAVTIVAGHNSNGAQSGFSAIKKFFVANQIVKSISFTDRQNRIAVARAAWRHEPIFGLGLGRANNDTTADYSTALMTLPRRYGYDQVATFNMYWELLAESGLLGFFTFLSFALWLIGKGVLRYWQSHDPEQRVWLLATSMTVVAIFIQAYTFTGFYLMFIWVELGLLAGLLLQKEEVT